MEEEPDKSKSVPDTDIIPHAQQLIEKIEKENPGLLEGVSDKEKLAETITSYFFSLEYEESHSGPLPSPKTLKQYNEIIKDGAERIMKTFEKQSSHRMKLEKKVVCRQTFQSQLGQIFGFIIACACLGGGIYLVMNGHDAAGITLFSLDIVGLVYVFVIGKKDQRKSLQENE